MSKYKSINYQFHEKMEELKCFGEKKHEAKKASPTGQVEGIYSYNTYKKYKQTLCEFSDYLKKNGMKYRYVEDIPREVFGSYLQSRNELSAWTVSADMAAFNKVMKFGFTKKELGLKERSYKDVKRSRRDVKHDKEINLSNYADAVLLAKATGCRRQSILKMEKGDFFIDDEKALRVALVEKGGRPRDALVLEEYREAVEAFLRRSEGSGKLIEKYPSRIDNHAYRGEYARKLYAYFESKNLGGGKLYRGRYDEELLRMVSKNLGHNRVSVVFYHYMR